MNRNAGWVNLYKCRVRHVSTFFVGLPLYATVAAHCVGRKEKYISIASGSYYYCVCAKAFYFGGCEVTCYNSASLSINSYHIEHVMAVVHFYLPFGNLAV